jgi:hypothetical protein
MDRKITIGITSLTALCSPFADAVTVSLQPIQDTSIYSENDNNNGLGFLYAGETAASANFALRRALMQFNVAGSIPAGSTIDSVTLTLTLTKNGAAGTAAFSLNPLLAAWSAGTSSGSGLGGAPTPGSATWNYSSFNTNLWASAGGAIGASSGTTNIGTSIGSTYTFASQSGMVADVQGWLDSPGTNFGWALKAVNESPNIVSAKELGSLESAPSSRPSLMITYTIPEPGTLALLCFGLPALLMRRRR